MKTREYRGKRIDTGEWTYGSLISCCFADCYIGRVEKVEGDKILLDTVLVAPETVGQYTGLKDKNKKKIYEGDIVRVSNTIYKVIYQDCGFELACTGNRVNMFRNIEVIGNETDNPELLKEKR